MICYSTADLFQLSHPLTVLCFSFAFPSNHWNLIQTQNVDSLIEKKDLAPWVPVWFLTSPCELVPVPQLLPSPRLTMYVREIIMEVEVVCRLEAGQTLLNKKEQIFEVCSQYPSVN